MALQALFHLSESDCIVHFDCAPVSTIMRRSVLLTQSRGTHRLIAIEARDGTVGAREVCEIEERGMEHDTMDTLGGVHAAMGGSSVLQGNSQLA